MKDAALSPSFLNDFRQRDFVEVGSFHLDEAGHMACQLGPYDILNTSFAIYAFVGFADGGKPLRIGESAKRPVVKRILEYPRYINDACSESLGSNGYFAGGTKPWERDGWFGYLRQFGTGLIFVKAGISKDKLHSVQNELIAKYAPPFCNESRGSKPLRDAWKEINGKPVKHYKRPRPFALAIS